MENLNVIFHGIIVLFIVLFKPRFFLQMNRKLSTLVKI